MDKIHKEVVSAEVMLHEYAVLHYKNIRFIRVDENGTIYGTGSSDGYTFKLTIPCDMFMVAEWDDAVGVVYLGNGKYEVTVDRNDYGGAYDDGLWRE